MKLIRRLAGIAAASAIGIAGFAFNAAPAQAVFYDFYDVCKGFTKIDEATFKTQNGIKVGMVYLGWKGSTGENCVATIKSTPGTSNSKLVLAGIQIEGNSTKYTDSGDFTYYASITKKAAGKEIKWGGAIVVSDSQYAEYVSPWEHGG
ncbi:MAG: hypothetical protein HOQ05_06305 [Corynebacteriales bacterium]|nr:hypothetical protein [Mycobacteriales bacterium]